jgi:hypothetical protein
MAKIMLSWLLLFFACLSGNALLAQTISNVNPNIKLLDGGAYYVHEVLAGQEIEDISKAYYSPIADILKENPEIRMGLKPGMTLRIPYTDESLEAMTNEKAALAVLSDVTPKKLEQKPDRVPATPIRPQKQPEPVKSQTPMQEAVSLLTLDDPEPVVEKKKEQVEEVVIPVEVPAEPEPEPKPEPELVEEVVRPEMEDVAEPVMEEPKVEELEEKIEEEVVAPLVEEKPAEVKERTTRRVNIEPNPDGQSLEEKAELADLSESIRESLSTLEKMKKALAGESIDEVPTTYVPTGDENYALDFLKEKLNERLASDSGLNEFYLKEYFMANVDPKGVIVSIRDERTITNQNTQDLEIQDVAGLMLEGYPKLNDKSGEAAIGLNADVSVYHYKLKIKKKKIRMYNDAMFVEFMDEENPHFDLIMNEAQKRDQRGKCQVVIADGTMNTARYSKVEYNPFAKQKNIIDEEKVLRLVALTFL